MKLLTIDNDPKTVKGHKRGYRTAVMYLAPYTASGTNLCPMAELAGCHEGCLNTAGRGGIAKANAIIATDAGNIPDNVIQRARLERARLFNENRPEFMAQLVNEIKAFIKKARRDGLIPAIRLNGTSDIQWERIPVAGYANIFEMFPETQYYDYTKIAKRFRQKLPANYHLSLSYSYASARYAAMCIKAHHEHKANLVIVVRDDETKQEFLRDSRAVDGDETDLRFLDPAGSLVYLKAKGRARKDTTGFVIDTFQNVNAA